MPDDNDLGGSMPGYFTNIGKERIRQRVRELDEQYGPNWAGTEELDLGGPVQRVARAAWVFAHRVDTDWPEARHDPDLKCELVYVRAVLSGLLGEDPFRARRALHQVDESYMRVPDPREEK